QPSPPRGERGPEGALPVEHYPLWKVRIVYALRIRTFQSEGPAWPFFSSTRNSELETAGSARYTRLMISASFWPPKPKLLDRQTSTWAARDWLGTWSMPEAGSGLCR